MNENGKNLLTLIAENPELPVVPMVDGEVCCGEEYGYYMGNFGHNEVGEYAVFGERVYFDREELKEDYYNANDDTYSDMSEKEIEESLDKDTEHMWTKAIIVYIASL